MHILHGQVRLSQYQSPAAGLKHPHIVFSRLRAFALKRSLVLGMLVFLLSIVPIGINLVFLTFPGGKALNNEILNRVGLAMGHPESSFRRWAVGVLIILHRLS